MFSKNNPKNVSLCFKEQLNQLYAKTKIMFVICLEKGKVTVLFPNLKISNDINLKEELEYKFLKLQLDKLGSVLELIDETINVLEKLEFEQYDEKSIE